MGAIDDLRIAHVVGATVPVEDESLLLAASVEPPFEQPCVARRGRIEKRPDVFLHFCVECGLELNLSQQLLGDPPPGYSALDRNRQARRERRLRPAAAL